MKEYRIGETMSDEDSLAHYGVKGMRWGKRKAAGGEGSKPKISRKQNREMNREARQNFDSKKATSIYNEAKRRGDKVLVEIQVPGATHKTVVTGKELADHLEAGGAMNVRTTEIYARYNAVAGGYEMNSSRIGNYKKQNFRKS